jgi:hypothetical protein
VTKNLKNTVNGKQNDIIIIGLLLLLLISVFSISLHFMPAQGDDLRLLSSVANTQNPLEYFFTDAGEGKEEYRPLFSIPLWCVYKLFGVRASINQLISLVLHFVNVLLLLRIMHRVQTDRILLFLLSAIFLVSINTVSPASWVADRSTSLVAFFLLIVLDYLIIVDCEKSQIRISYIAIASILALMSKESGVIVAILLIIASFHITPNNSYRAKIIMTSIIVITSYLGLRFIIFGSNPPSTIDVGYGPGIIYDNWVSALSPHLKIKECVITLITNLSSPVLPIYGLGGEVLQIKDLLRMIFIWFPSALIFYLSFNRKLTTLQKYALIVIILNSIIHCVAFRYRLQYLSWIGVCLFIAGSPAINNKWDKKIIVYIFASILLIFSTYTVSWQLQKDWLRRYEAIRKDNLQKEIYDHRLFGNIDDNIVEQIIFRYKKNIE